jgi:hypothetical protein
VAGLDRDGRAADVNQAQSSRQEEFPVRRPRWRTGFRLLPSRFPTVGLYDGVADPTELDVVFAIEALTNERLRHELGHIELVPPSERLVGPGSTPIMAAFTHLNPEGSRFSDGTYGVYYAGESLETAVAEVSHHRARFLRRTAEPAMELDLRCIRANIEARLHDLRGLARPDLYDPDDYTQAQALGRKLRAAGSSGVIYDSVRRRAGQCVGIFKPRALSRARQGPHITLIWDGNQIAGWYQKSALRSVQA